MSVGRRLRHGRDSPGARRLRQPARFVAPHSQPQAASRPFDKGTGWVVLEKAARCLFWKQRRPPAAVRPRLCRSRRLWGQQRRAYMVIPSPDPEPAMAAMRKALPMPASEPAAVDYINAHATSTPVGDMPRHTSWRQCWAMLSRRAGQLDQEHDGTLPDGCGRRRSAHMPDCHGAPGACRPPSTWMIPSRMQALSRSQRGAAATGARGGLDSFGSAAAIPVWS